MSAEASGIRWATCSPVRASGRRPTSARPAMTKLSPLSKCTRHRAGAWRSPALRLLRRDLLLGRGRGAAGAGAAAAASPGAGRWGGGLRRGGRLRLRGGGGERRCVGDGGPAGAAATSGGSGWRRIECSRALGGADRLDGRGRDEPHRGEVDDVARSLVARRVGDLGTGRTSTTTVWARWSCQPRRWRPRSSTAVQARVARPMPKVGRPEAPEHQRAQQGRPDADRGAGAVVDHAQARHRLAGRGAADARARSPRTSQSTHHRAGDGADDGPDVVDDDQRGHDADDREQAPGQQPVDGEGGEASLELGDGVGQGVGAAGSRAGSLRRW